MLGTMGRSTGLVTAADLRVAGFFAGAAFFAAAFITVFLTLVFTGAFFATGFFDDLSAFDEAAFLALAFALTVLFFAALAVFFDFAISNPLKSCAKIQGMC
jgi:hypothetical protein